MAFQQSLHRTAPRRRPRAVVDPRPDVDVGSETAAGDSSETVPVRITRPVVDDSPRRATARVDGKADIR